MEGVVGTPIEIDAAREAYQIDVGSNEAVKVQLRPASGLAIARVVKQDLLGALSERGMVAKSLTFRSRRDTTGRGPSAVSPWRSR